MSVQTGKIYKVVVLYICSLGDKEEGGNCYVYVCIKKRLCFVCIGQLQLQITYQNFF